RSGQRGCQRNAWVLSHGAPRARPCLPGRHSTGGVTLLNMSYRHCARPSRYRHRVIWSTRARVRGAQTGRNTGDPDGTPLALRVTMDAVAFVSVARRWSPVPLRLIVGCGFIAHGYAKAVNGPGHFAASLHALGVPAPHAMAWATIGVELLGGF